jgi:MATE family multidrug resistance protein
MEHKVVDDSLKSIFSITIPMVLSFMSTNLMYTIDKFMLAGYSINAMNAASIAGSFAGIFSFMFTGMTDSAEIFVGQYNGSKQYHKLADPVWQMIYLALASSLVFVPVAYFSDTINTLPDYCLKEGLEYQKTLMYFGMISPIKTALSAFFIGQGKTKIITLSVVMASVTNIVLDYILIYGIADVIPSMGCVGAAIATVIAEFAQIVVLVAIFFGKNNRKIYKTFENRKFNPPLLCDCVRIGFPQMFGNLVSMLAWYSIQSLTAHISKDIATIYNIGITIYIFFIFVGEGMNKAIATICANMIGRQDLPAIKKTYRFFVAMSIFCGAVISIPLVFFPECIFSLLSTLPGNLSILYGDIKIVLCLVTVNVAFETLMLSTWGVLIAGGDTKYAAIVYQICLWLLVVFPTMLLYLLDALYYVPTIYAFMTAWVVAAQICMYKRYKSLKWYNKLG